MLTFLLNAAESVASHIVGVAIAAAPRSLLFAAACCLVFALLGWMGQMGVES